MQLTDIYYITQIILNIVLLGAAIIITYQFITLKQRIEEIISNVTSVAEGVAMTKYTAQYAVSKFLLRLLGGGDDEK